MTNMAGNPWINYHHLYYFMTIAQEGSVSKAAAKLRLGQPTLSTQLKLFEDTLGIELFERHHKRLILSEQGKVALEYAKNIFRLGGEMYDALHDRLKPNRLSLQLGTIDGISKYVTLGLAKAAFAIAPCQIHFVEGGSDELLHELTSHKIDLLLLNYLPHNASALGLKQRSLPKEPLAVFGALHFAPLRTNFPESLRGKPMVLPTQESRSRISAESWLSDNGLEVDIIAESQDLALNELMAVQGMALLICTPSAVHGRLEKGELLQIGAMQNTTEELYLLAAKRKIENPIASILIRTFSL